MKTLFVAHIYFSLACVCAFETQPSVLVCDLSIVGGHTSPHLHPFFLFTRKDSREFRPKTHCVSTKMFYANKEQDCSTASSRSIGLAPVCRVHHIKRMRCMLTRIYAYKDKQPSFSFYEDFCLFVMITYFFRSLLIN